MRAASNRSSACRDPVSHPHEMPWKRRVDARLLATQIDLQANGLSGHYALEICVLAQPDREERVVLRREKVLKRLKGAGFSLFPSFSGTVAVPRYTGGTDAVVAGFILENVARPMIINHRSPISRHQLRKGGLKKFG